MSIMRTLTINGAKFNVTQVVPASSVTLLAGSWVGGGESYSQVVELPGITAHTKVDLQPTAEQLAEFHYKVLSFVAENDGGVVTVYAIGDKPRGDHTIQTTLTEVEAIGKIRGNTVGTTMPRPDVNQTDPNSADYIRGRETLVRSVNGSTPDENGNVTVEGVGTGEATDEQIAAAVGAYMEEHPVECDGVKTVNGTPPDENGNVEVAGGNSDIIYVTIDWDTMKASMTSHEIMEAMQNGKMVAYKDEVGAAFANIDFREDGISEPIIHAYFMIFYPHLTDVGMANVEIDSVIIDNTGAVTFGSDSGEQIVGVPYPGTIGDVGKVLTVTEDFTAKWVDPATIPALKGEPGKDGSDGITPHIGENGNWWIGEADTGVSASGSSGSGSSGESSSSDSNTVYTIIDESAMTSSMSDVEIDDALNAGKTVIGVTKSGSFPLAIYRNPFGVVPVTGTLFNTISTKGMYGAKTYLIEGNTVTIKSQSQMVPSPVGSKDAGKVPTATETGDIEWKTPPGADSEIVIVHLDMVEMKADKTSSEIIQMANNEGKTILASDQAGQMYTCSIQLVNSTIQVVFTSMTMVPGTQVFGVLLCVVGSDGAITMHPIRNLMAPCPIADDIGKVYTVTGVNDTECTAEWVDPSTLSGGGGKDGVSATHEWNGTVLTITSASGTSSADLKGGKGDPGYTPVKGTDYWTAADKTEMVNDVLAALPIYNGEVVEV